MVSKAVLMSPSESIGWRMRRAESRLSACMARSIEATRSAAVFQDGANWSMALKVIQVAKASLSQRSSHHPVVTMSPNQRCANSCASTPAARRKNCGVSVPGLARLIRCAKVISPGFSMAPPPSGTSMRSSLG